MRDSVLEHFLEYDCTSFEARRIREAAAKPEDTYLTFNRWNVKMEPAKGLATIEDELDTDREESTTIEALLSRLPE